MEEQVQAQSTAGPQITPAETIGTNSTAETRALEHPAGQPILQYRRWFAVAAVLLIALLLFALYAWRTGASLEELAALGYPGVFLVMLLSGASVFFPAPGQASVLAAGAVWNPVLVGIAGGLGNSVGELVGYAAGLAGVSTLERRALPRWWAMLQGWLSRYGFFAVLVLAMIPNPAFDAVGLLAGSLRYPVRRFWLACALGNSLKYTVVAFLGDAASWWLS